jgi:hypothetical protein
MILAGSEAAYSLPKWLSPSLAQVATGLECRNARQVITIYMPSAAYRKANQPRRYTYR